MGQQLRVLAVLAKDLCRFPALTTSGLKSPVTSDPRVHHPSGLNGRQLTQGTDTHIHAHTNNF